jgi:regulator of sigma E protease
MINTRNFVMNALIDLTSYIAILLVIVGLHEFGHFIVAKRFGLVASIFALGFGRVWFSRTDKSGTSWQLRVLPLGGFIKLNETELEALPALKRIVIYAAGPLFNIALGLVLVMIAGVAYGVPALKSLEISFSIAPHIVSTLVGAVWGVFMGNISNLSGPVGAAIASGDAVRLHGVIQFAGLFSWSVGVINLLPVPLLDGGQIALSGLEIAVGKLSKRTLKFASYAGLSFVGSLMLAGLASDIIRLIG